MTLELKEREDERDNIVMTLYRHESDSQRLLYVKNTLTDDLSRKEEQIASLKEELRDMSNLTVIANASPQSERSFRRLRGRASKLMAKNATASMSSYYTEKLNKIDRHIKLRQEECENLGKELEKLEADSQIFVDLAKDLSDRLNDKEKQMSSMKGKTKDQLKKLGVTIEKNQEEREQLVAELARLQADSETFSALVNALTEERKTKLEHVEKYKKRHREMAASVGIKSPYIDSGSGSGDDIDDDASVSSTWSLMSVDTVATSTPSTFVSGTIAKVDYDQKISQLEANITKFEEDRIFILNDLEKLESDTHAFTELSSSLKLKLRQKEDQIVKVKKELDEFRERLKNQEKELANLTKDEKADTKEDSGDGAYMNGRGEEVVIR
jgi:chromosome segregation ATPase